MSYNKTYKHKRNGLIQESFYTYDTGFKITVSIGTGIDGESTCITIWDANIYPDDDSRSKRSTEYIIPLDDTEDLKRLKNIIDKALKERQKTLIKSI